MRQSYKNEIILSQAELDAAMARGRKMRAAAFAYYMGALGRSIALALVKGGHDKKGQKIFAPLESKTVTAEIVDPVFYDKEGERLNG